MALSVIPSYTGKEGASGCSVCFRSRYKSSLLTTQDREPLFFIYNWLDARFAPTGTFSSVVKVPQKDPYLGRKRNVSRAFSNQPTRSIVYTRLVIPLSEEEKFLRLSRFPACLSSPSEEIPVVKQDLRIF